MRHWIVGIIAIISFACGACGGGEGQQVSVSATGSFLIVMSNCSFADVNETLTISEDGQISIVPQPVSEAALGNLAKGFGGTGGFSSGDSSSEDDYVAATQQDEDETISGPISASIMVDGSSLSCNGYYGSDVVAIGCDVGDNTCYMQGNKNGTTDASEFSSDIDEGADLPDVDPPAGDDGEDDPEWLGGYKGTYCWDTGSGGVIFKAFQISTDIELYIADPNVIFDAHKIDFIEITDFSKPFPNLLSFELASASNPSGFIDVSVDFNGSSIVVQDSAGDEATFTKISDELVTQCPSSV